MANPEHLQILKQGVEVWNRWKEENSDIRPNLIRADLSKVSLRGADLTGVDLSKADLSEADLGRVDLSGANLSRANLTRVNLSAAHLLLANLSQAHLYKAFLSGARFGGANLQGADLKEANLGRADLWDANLQQANLSGARLYKTIFGNTNLTSTKGLETCNYAGPSIIDHFTLMKSGRLPLSFLRGCGLPDTLINYLPSLLNEPIQFYSCFISYSHEDEAFIKRLHADLQNKGVRCWYAAEDMKIGDRIRDTIDQQIRLREKLLVVLSSTSIASEWVEDEVEAALEEERKSQVRRTALFPIKIDNAVEDTNRAWVRKIKRTRHIGDFTHWKDHDAYQTAFNRLLHDLKVEDRFDSPKS